VLRGRLTVRRQLSVHREQQALPALLAWNPNRRGIAVTPVVCFFLFSTILACAQELTLTQRLVVACNGLDVDVVIRTLRSGAEVNGRFGSADPRPFEDRWFHGCPMGTHEWTPLIALAFASRYPDPPRELQNTTEDFLWAKGEIARIPKHVIQEREQRLMAILQVLLSHNCALDADDGHGATALYTAIYCRHEEMARTLILYGAKVNTKTDQYIDGPADITPLHQAYWSVGLTRLLLEHGADPHAKDSDGKLPADWAGASETPEQILAIYASFERSGAKRAADLKPQQ